MYNTQAFITRVGVATLNQWAMDFESNKRNIIESIKIAKERGCTYRVGPELEICGYSCEDHFLENDTVQHCWEVLADILSQDLTENIIVDMGMPVIHKNVFYNCRVICYNQEVKLIRPKMFLADDGNYRESRWFTAWQKENLEQFQLPEIITKIKKQQFASIGIAIMSTIDTEIGIEICEELWVPEPTSTRQALDGAEIIVNSSGSHFELRKMNIRTNLIRDITQRNGGAYLFSNLRGCDGNRVYFDGLSVIAINGTIFKASEMFSLKDVEVITCDLDLSQVRNQRINFKSRSIQAAKTHHFERIHINMRLTQVQFLENELIPLPPQYPSYKEDEEMFESIGCYLWDYLRRSGASGYFLPLSGGADSAASACGVYSMCLKVFHTLNNNQTEDDAKQSKRTLHDLRGITRSKDFCPKSPEDLMNKLFQTAYLGSKNSSKETRCRAKKLAERLGSKHYEVEIDQIVQSFQSSIKPIFQEEPRFEADGGTPQEDIALQNIQARTRMVLSYLIAQLAPWNDGKQGFLLVLGSSNLDEGLTGYLTKYDCSSADINPLGSLTKNDLKKLINYCNKRYNIPTLNEILTSNATAELRPASGIVLRDPQVQNSEDDMGMKFDQIEVMGKLRKVHRLGPFGMFRRLLPLWNNMKPSRVAELVKNFYTRYAQHRHKSITLTPSFHAESHSNDDNRYDLRQFLYNTRWPFQFKRIDDILSTYETNTPTSARRSEK